MRLRLLPDRLVDTAGKLQARIAERFPGSSLSDLALNLREIARDSAARARRIRRPRIALRVLLGAIVLAAVVVLIAALGDLRVDFGPTNGWQLLQTTESILSAMVFLGAAVLFLLTLESRSKRREVLAAIEDLRVLAHIVDMHQLTKDPDRILRRGPATASSPTSELDAFQLSRYLDYCSELLSLIGKIPVLYAQGSHDPVVLEAVDDMENLTTGLSRKMWQKIMILHRAEEE